jgi:hypothetical protein
MYKSVILLVFALAILPHCYGQAVDETKSEFTDIAILKNGNAIHCKITACDTNIISYTLDNLESKTIPVNEVLTFSVQKSARYSALNIPLSVLKDKYFDEQDLFLLHSGRRLKATLISINSLNFVIKLSGDKEWARGNVADNGLMDLPQDSVFAFYSQKQNLDCSVIQIFFVFEKMFNFI